MNGLRVAVRAPALGLWTAACALAWGLAALPARALGARERLRAGVFRAWARGTTRLIGMRIDVQGAPPEPPFLLVSNHLGYVDIVLFASELRCVFLSMSEVARWPFLGVLSRAMETLFVDRTKRADVVRVGRAIEERLARGQGVVFFPEGTSGGGDDVQRFHSALLQPAVEHGWPVHWATIRYRTPPGEPPASEAVAWWGDRALLPHARALLSLPWFEACIVFGAATVGATDRKRLAQELYGRVRSGLAGGAPATLSHRSPAEPCAPSPG